MDDFYFLIVFLCGLSPLFPVFLFYLYLDSSVTLSSA